jgi:mono/diheme cytochrome c family protein
MRTRYSIWPALLLALLLAACYPNPAPAGLTPVPTLAGGGATVTPVNAVTPLPTRAPGQGDANLGQMIFNQNCVACHGQGGVGGQIGKALVANPFVQGDTRAVHDVVANGRPGTAMPAFSQAKGGVLSEQEIDDVVAYIRTLD